MLSMNIDMSIKDLNDTLNLLTEDNVVKNFALSEFIKTFPDKYGHVETVNFMSKCMKITVSPHELIEYGGLFRVREFTLIIRSDTLCYDEVIEVLKGLKAPF